MLDIVFSPRTDLDIRMLLGGGYIRYPDIKGNNTFLRNDGVHLASLSNRVFLNTIQRGGGGGARGLFAERSMRISRSVLGLKTMSNIRQVNTVITQESIISLNIRVTNVTSTITEYKSTNSAI
jgi:hypothetical protein